LDNQLTLVLCITDIKEANKGEWIYIVNEQWVQCKCFSKEDNKRNYLHVSQLDLFESVGPVDSSQPML